MTICATIAINRPVSDPEIGISIHDEDGVVAFGTTSRELGRGEDPLAAGERLADQNLARQPAPARALVHRLRAARRQGRDRRVPLAGGASFVVHGTRPQTGLVAIEHRFEVRARQRHGGGATMSTAEVALRADARSIRGPSAFGGGLRRLVFLTWTMGLTEYRLTYFGSALGLAVGADAPAADVRGPVRGLQRDRPLRRGHPELPRPAAVQHRAVHLLHATRPRAPWPASSSARRSCARCTSRAMVIPLSRVLTAVLNLLVSLVAVFVVRARLRRSPAWTWLLLPVVAGRLLPVHRRRVDAAVGALRALSGTWRRSGRSCRRRCSTARRCSTRSSRCPEDWRTLYLLQPARQPARAGAALDRRPGRPGHRRRDRRGRLGARAARRSAWRPACSASGCSTARRRGSPSGCEREASSSGRRARSSRRQTRSSCPPSATPRTSFERQRRRAARAASRSSTSAPDLGDHEAAGSAASAGRSPRVAAASRWTGSRSRRCHPGGHELERLVATGAASA